MQDLVARMVDREKARRASLVLRGALAVSIAGHLLLGLCMRVHAWALEPTAPALAPPSDVWAGDSPFDASLVEVTVGEMPVRATEAPSQPPAPADPEPAAPAPDPTPPPAPAPDRVEPSSRPTDPKDPPEVPLAPPADPRPPADDAGAQARSEPGASSPAARPPVAPQAGGPTDASFGSAGKPQVRELAVAITRGIPRAGVANARWGELSSGTRLALEIVLSLDASGALVAWRPARPDPPRAVVELFDNLLLSLKRTKFSHEAVIEAADVTLALELEAQDVDVPDDHPGGPVRLSFVFEDGVGNALFIQPSGRQIAIDVRVVDPTAR